MEHWVNVHETHCYKTKEKEFNDWYNTIHLPDVIETKGFVNATRYQIKEPKNGRGSYLCVYEIETEDIEETLRIRGEKIITEIAAGRSSDLWVPAWFFVFFRRTIRKTSSVNVHDPSKGRWIDLVETNPVPGKENDFNAWYDEHLDDVLKTPGFVAASRYVIKEPMEGRGKYLAIYEIETDNIEETLQTRLEWKAEDVRQGKDQGLLEAVWGSTLFREIFRYPPSE